MWGKASRGEKAGLFGCLVGLALCVYASTASCQQSAFDPAEGFGAKAQGGAGGRILTVTTLADRGPGSLREALTAAGPRIIRFAVAGTIVLESFLDCREGRVTIDGTSAPDPGITLLHFGLRFLGDCDDVIVRDLRVRITPRAGEDADGLLFWGRDGGTIERVLIDHCSIMWATDENIDTWGRVRELTCQWTIIAEGRLPHSMGWISSSETDRVTIHHCLFAHNGDRNPRVAGGLYDIRNNVIYNWINHNAAKIVDGAHANLINNIFIPGLESKPQAPCILPAAPERGTQLFLAGNIAPSIATDAGAEQWSGVIYYEWAGEGWIAHYPAPASLRAQEAFAVASVQTQSAAEAYRLVLARVGPRFKDPDDLRVLRDVCERTGHVGYGGSSGDPG